MKGPTRVFTVDNLKVEVYPTREAMGQSAAAGVAQRMQQVVAEKGSVNMLFAAAPSQDDLLAALVATSGLPWDKVNALHLDEYIGLSPKAPQRFSNYLRQHLFDKVDVGQVFFLDPGDDPEAEVRRYAELLKQYPPDMACIGIGENGHIAFNDPPVADFQDPVDVKIVELDERCRLQQVHDGCFRSLEETPTHAITLTVPAIMRSGYISCVVPGPTKQEAVLRTLNGEISTECPASVLRRHINCRMFLDEVAAALVRQ